MVFLSSTLLLLRFSVLVGLLFLICPGVFAQRVPATVVARPGDGAHALLRRYGLTSPQHFQQFLTLNKANLTTGNGLLVGRAYRLPTGTADRRAAPARAATPSGPSVLQAPVFGPPYARVTVRDRALRGAVYYLSAGHGGPDPGAIGKYGTYRLAEDEYAYDVTLRLARVLMEHGATVYLLVQDPNDGIRDASILPIDHDEVTYPHQRIPLNQLSRLQAAHHSGQ